MTAIQRTNSKRTNKKKNKKQFNCLFFFASFISPLVSSVVFCTQINQLGHIEWIIRSLTKTISVCVCVCIVARKNKGNVMENTFRLVTNRNSFTRTLLNCNLTEKISIHIHRVSAGGLLFFRSKLQIDVNLVVDNAKSRHEREEREKVALTFRWPKVDSLCQVWRRFRFYFQATEMSSTQREII